MDTNWIEITTNKCCVCSNATTLRVELDSYRSWLIDGEMVQDAFPAMSAEERELLITGTHPECWDSMFGDDDE